MHTVTSIDTLTHEEVRQLAKGAVERGESMADSNVFEPESIRHTWFEHAYQQHAHELTEA